MLMRAVLWCFPLLIAVTEDLRGFGTMVGTALAPTAIERVGNHVLNIAGCVVRTASLAREEASPAGAAA